MGRFTILVFGVENTCYLAIVIAEILSSAAAFWQTRVLITLIPIFWPPPPPYVKCNAFFIVIPIVNFNAFIIFTVKINAFFSPPPPYVKCNGFFIVIPIVNFDAFTIFTVKINAFFSEAPRIAIFPSPHNLVCYHVRELIQFQRVKSVFYVKNQTFLCHLCGSKFQPFSV